MPASKGGSSRKTHPDRHASPHKGLRPVRIWLPRIDAATFRREAHRQSLAVATGPGEIGDQLFIDAISDDISGEE
jgi:hypothetical protein